MDPSAKKEKPFYSDSEDSNSSFAGRRTSNNFGSSSILKGNLDFIAEDEDRKKALEQELREEDDDDELEEDDADFFSSSKSEQSLDNADDEDAGKKTKKLDESKKISELFVNDFLDKEQALKDLLANDDIRTVEDVINKRKKEIERKERIEKEKEAKAQRKALMRKPIEYTNMIKVYVICFVYKFLKIADFAYSLTNRAFLLSRIPHQALKELQEFISYSHSPQDFEEKIKKILSVFNQTFRFKKMNESAYLINMSTGYSFTHLQINQLFLSLLHFLKFPTRLCYIVDLRYFKIDKRHRTLPNHRAKNTKNKKRSFDELRSQNLNEYKQVESKAKLKGRSLLDLCISSILEEKPESYIRKTTDNNSFKEEDDSCIDDESMKIEENEGDSRMDNSSNPPIELEDMFDKFKFKSTPKNEVKNSYKTEISTPKDTEGKKKIASLASHLETMENIKKIEDDDIDQLYGFKKKGSLSVSKSPNKSPTKSESDTIKNPELKRNTHDGARLESLRSQGSSKPSRLPYEYGFERPGKAGDSYEYEEYNYWVEVYDIQTKRWVAIDPIKKELGGKDHEMITKKMIGNSNLFIIANTILSERELKVKKGLPVHGLFFSDITQYYCEKWAKVLISRKQISLKFWWEDVLKWICCSGGRIKSPLWKFILDNDNEILKTKMMFEIPSNYNEMRNSSYYVIPSMLRKYQGMNPGAKPVDFKFKEEYVYKREDIVDLHTRSKWLSFGRKVKKGEKSLKQVLALTGGGERMVDLFGEWQTEPWENKLNEDGSLPRNEYGNYEVFNGKPPEGTLHIDLPGLPKILKKHNLEFVEAVVGFERGKSGRSHVIKSGVLAFQMDEERIRQLYEENKIEIEQRQKEKEQKATLSSWKKKRSHK